MDLSIFIISLCAIAVVIIANLLIEEIYITKNDITLYPSSLYRSIAEFFKKVAYNYYVYIRLYPTMEFSEESVQMYSKGDKVMYLGNEERSRYATIKMVYNSTLILKPHKNGILR